jgi:putative transposase
VSGRIFKEFGLPRAIRTDNGVPFSCARAIFGLSKLSVWWLRLGIDIERIKPGHPQQNGRHERMHLTLKKEATHPAARNLLQQQGRFDDFVEEFNRERPHQALAMRCPAEDYRPSARPYRGLEPIDYPFHDRTLTVTRCGRVCFGRRKVNLSRSLAGQNVGVKQITDDIWLVSFMHYDLEFFDHESCRLECAENPFAAKLSPMSSA